MSPDPLRSLLDRLRSAGPHARNPSDGSGHGVFHTEAMRRFICGMQGQPSPVMLDLGPASGTNVAFLGERLGCKVYFDDLFAGIEKLAGTRRDGQLDQFLAARFPHAGSSMDGVLCWDVLDYLPGPAAHVFAAQLTRLLRPGGMLMALVGTIPHEDGCRKDYVIVDDEHLQHRLISTSLVPQPVRLRRDVERLFGALYVDECFLLRHHQQEYLFRKPLEGHSCPVPSSRS